VLEALRQEVARKLRRLEDHKAAWTRPSSERDACSNPANLSG